ncbi:AP-5 complex subunit zeta-1-like [Homalodisca vitripennis]|uniref:AP-5 complex subunit zeta-1-like n=1 Tax=Homalodisca vitripennis TaxID=197043 RepID=UPI001EEC5E17|nr:AP-5 complex subunit zeta-1-like [Homalodisca vitripennis]
MDLRKALVQSRKQPAQQVETLWENIYQHNVKVEALMSILAFYLHHRVYPPPVQKALDSLLMCLTDSRTTRRLRTLLSRTLEEMCAWLGPDCILDTVQLSASPSVVADLLPCLLINPDTPRPEAAFYERLISGLTSPGLSQEDRCKVLGFVSATVPAELMPMLTKHLVSWLSYSRSSQTNSLFRSADVTDIDGSPATGLCTALTLVTTVTDIHMLSVVTFSNIRQYLRRAPADSSLVSAVFSYCSTLLAQATKKPSTQHDKQLVAVVLEEVLLTMKAVKEADNSCRGRCQLMVGNVLHLADQLRLTPLLISVWQYHLVDGGDSPLTERVLGAVIKAEFSQGLVSQRVATVVVAHGSQLAESLARYCPSLLKLVATHPSGLVEEFLDLMPYLTVNTELTAEVLHCLLDLPLLSATICVSQTSLLVQAGFKVTSLMSVKQQIDGTADLKVVYKHFMRSKAQAGETDALVKLYPAYWSALKPVLSQGLVEVCSQVAPLLLSAFLDSVRDCNEANNSLMPAIFARLPLLCPLPSYQKAVFDLLSQYVTTVWSQQPELLGNPCVAQFLSVTSNIQLCPQLFDTIVSAVGNNLQNPLIKRKSGSMESKDATLEPSPGVDSRKAGVLSFLRTTSSSGSLSQGGGAPGETAGTPSDSEEVTKTDSEPAKPKTSKDKPSPHLENI